jgi:hypothetical protein
LFLLKLRYRPLVATDDPGPLVLPPDGALVLDSLDLPAGRRIRAATGQAGTGQPEIEALWMTDEQVEDAGSKWWGLRQESGLQPVVLDSLTAVARVGERRPWDSELVIWDAPVRGRETVEQTLAHFWTMDAEDEMALDWKLPYSAFPGLAPGQEEPLSDIELELVTGSAPRGWVGLTTARRSADIPMTIGWFGCSDAFGGSFSPGVMTAVLRSWDDRFGAVVFRLGWASLQLLVTRPPRTEQEALAVAAEFFGFADEFTTADGATRSVREMAASITGSPWWRFWWD